MGNSQRSKSTLENVNKKLDKENAFVGRNISSDAPGYYQYCYYGDHVKFGEHQPYFINCIDNRRRQHPPRRTTRKSEPILPISVSCRPHSIFTALRRLKRSNSNDGYRKNPSAFTPIKVPTKFSITVKNQSDDYFDEFHRKRKHCHYYHGVDNPNASAHAIGHHENSAFTPVIPSGVHHSYSINSNHGVVKSRNNSFSADNIPEIRTTQLTSGSQADDEMDSASISASAIKCRDSSRRKRRELLNSEKFDSYELLHRNYSGATGKSVNTTANESSSSIIGVCINSNHIVSNRKIIADKYSVNTYYDQVQANSKQPLLSIQDIERDSLRDEALSNYYFTTVAATASDYPDSPFLSSSSKSSTDCFAIWCGVNDRFCCCDGRTLIEKGRCFHNRSCSKSCKRKERVFGHDTIFKSPTNATIPYVYSVSSPVQPPPIVDVNNFLSMQCYQETVL